ncbi:MAG TPA: hypothetical protein VKV39_12305 [Candidatus Sulfotelmatobacter sp.]|nr:hypothetical protein [Candidatus Sulfotelmatobacter sp.]
MSDTTEAIAAVARDKARRRTNVQRFGSMMKGKIDKWKKPRNLINLAAEAAINAIPIPGIGNAADWIKEKAMAYFRDKQHAARLKGARANRDAAGAGIDEDYKVLKFEIKDLDPSNLDKSRKKVAQELRAYNVLAQDRSMAPCRRAYQLAYRLERAQYRAERLHILGATLQRLGADLVEFTDQVEKNLASKREDLPDDLDVMLAGADHSKCKSHCFQTEEGRFRMQQGLETVSLLSGGGNNNNNNDDDDF